MTPKNKKPLPPALNFALGGAEHREQEHIPRSEHQTTSRSEPSRKESTGRPGGRPKSFDCETERLPIALPIDLAHQLKILALNRKMTPSQVIAELLLIHLTNQ